MLSLVVDGKKRINGVLLQPSFTGTAAAGLSCLGHCDADRPSCTSWGLSFTIPQTYVGWDSMVEN